MAVSGEIRSRPGESFPPMGERHFPPLGEIEPSDWVKELKKGSHRAQSLKKIGIVNEIGSLHRRDNHKNFSSRRSAITPAGPACFPINLFPERAARGFPENAMPPSRWASFAAEAAVPEQLVPYVRAVSDLEPLECGGFLAWRSGPALVLVGHDAGLKQGGTEQECSRPEAARLDAAVREASSLRGIESLTVISPFRPDAAPEWAVSTKPDAYWGIPLPTDTADMAYGQKLRNQLRRARRDILIAREGWKPDHAELVEQYIRSRPFAPGTRHLFRHIGPYVEAVPDALLFAARDCEGALQGFAVGDYTALGTVFHLFAFRAPESPPGTADALLDALATEGIRRGHTLLNLGLGINPGIVFFKRKWNATILRPHMETSWAVQRPQEAGLLGSLKKLFGM